MAGVVPSRSLASRGVRRRRVLRGGTTAAARAIPGPDAAVPAATRRRDASTAYPSSSHSPRGEEGAKARRSGQTGARDVSHGSQPVGARERSRTHATPFDVCDRPSNSRLLQHLRSHHPRSGRSGPPRSRQSRFRADACRSAGPVVPNPHRLSSELRAPFFPSLRRGRLAA